jgi:hypothetical protein
MTTIKTDLSIKSWLEACYLIASLFIAGLAIFIAVTCGFHQSWIFWMGTAAMSYAAHREHKAHQ